MAITEKVAKRDGIGNLLAEGLRACVERIPQSKPYAVEAMGQAVARLYLSSRINMLQRGHGLMSSRKLSLRRRQAFVDALSPPSVARGILPGKICNALNIKRLQHEFASGKVATAGKWRGRRYVNIF